MCYYFRSFIRDKPPMFGNIVSHYSGVRVRIAFKTPNLSDVYVASRDVYKARVSFAARPV